MSGSTYIGTTARCAGAAPSEPAGGTDVGDDVQTAFEDPDTVAAGAARRSRDGENLGDEFCHSRRRCVAASGMEGPMPWQRAAPP